MGSIGNSRQEGRELGGVARDSASPKSRKRGYLSDEMKGKGVHLQYVIP